VDRVEKGAALAAPAAEAQPRSGDRVQPTAQAAGYGSSKTTAPQVAKEPPTRNFFGDVILSIGEAGARDLTAAVSFDGVTGS
jgi:hypothetical protein